MLFPSTLVICQDLSKIDNLLTELGHQSIINDPDIFLVTEYKVENIRQIKKFLSNSPYSHQNKIVIIPQADLLNLESQNTLLKNLEEPGTDNYFILTTTKPNSLLPTIVSRCHTIKYNVATKTATNFSLPNSISECLTLSETLSKDKTTVVPFIENLIATTDPRQFVFIQRLIKSSQMINANIDPKSVLDHLFLSMLV